MKKPGKKLTSKTSERNRRIQFNLHLGQEDTQPEARQTTLFEQSQSQQPPRDDDIRGYEFI